MPAVFSSRHVWGKSMIEVSHLLKSYRDLKSVNDVSFKVAKQFIASIRERRYRRA